MYTKVHRLWDWLYQSSVSYLSVFLSCHSFHCNTAIIVSATEHCLHVHFLMWCTWPHFSVALQSCWWMEIFVSAYNYMLDQYWWCSSFLVHVYTASLQFDKIQLQEMYGCVVCRLYVVYLINKLSCLNCLDSSRGIIITLRENCWCIIFIQVLNFYVRQRNSYRLDDRPSVCLSVTRWYCIKMAEHIVMLSLPHDSPFILVLCVSRCSLNSNRVTPCGAAKQSWGTKIS